jgi:hypothetical protein
MVPSAVLPSPKTSPPPPHGGAVAGLILRFLREQVLQAARDPDLSSGYFIEGAIVDSEVAIVGISNPEAFAVQLEAYLTERWREAARWQQATVEQEFDSVAAFLKSPEGMAVQLDNLRTTRTFRINADSTIEPVGRCEECGGTGVGWFGTDPTQPRRPGRCEECSGTGVEGFNNRPRPHNRPRPLPEELKATADEATRRLAAGLDLPEELLGVQRCPDCGSPHPEVAELIDCLNDWHNRRR